MRYIIKLFLVSLILSSACQLTYGFDLGEKGRLEMMPSLLTTENYGPHILKQAHEVLLKALAELEQNPSPTSNTILHCIHTKYYALFTQHANHRTLNQTKRAQLSLPFDALFYAQDKHGTVIFRAELIKSIITFFSIANATCSFSTKLHRLFSLTRILRGNLLSQLQQAHITDAQQPLLLKNVMDFTNNLYAYGIEQPGAWTWCEIAWFSLKAVTTIVTLIALVTFIQRMRKLNIRKTIQKGGQEIGQAFGQKTCEAFDSGVIKLQKALDQVVEQCSTKISEKIPTNLESDVKEILTRIKENTDSFKQICETLQTCLQALNKGLQKNNQ